MADPDELDARRRIIVSIEDEDDRAAVLAVFERIDWRRHMEALRHCDRCHDTREVYVFEPVLHTRPCPECSVDIEPDDP